MVELVTDPLAHGTTLRALVEIVLLGGAIVIAGTYVAGIYLIRLVWWQE